MADIFQPQLTPPSLKAESFVQRGVVDNSVATAVEGFGKLGTNVFKGSVLADLEGGEGNKDFVDPSDAQFADLTADEVLGNLNLTTITAARKQKKLTGAGAAALVNSKAKALINAHPYFAQEIKQATSQFFAGTGLTGDLFKDDMSLVDQAILAGVKAGRVDPTVSKENQILQVQAFSKLTTTKDQLNLLKLETDVDEQAKKVANFNLGKDWFNSMSIAIEKDLKEFVDLNLSDEDLIIRLRQFKADVDAEGRQDIDVVRYGEPNYKAQFESLISPKIDLEMERAQGLISQQVYETRNAVLKAMGTNKIMEIPGVPETVAVFDTVRNLPVGLISGETQIELSKLMVEITNLIPEMKLKQADPEATTGGSLPARSSEEAKLFYGMLTNTFGQINQVDQDNAEKLNSEIGVMLSAHADGVARYADTFDNKRWDQLITFFADPNALKYIKANGNKFSPEARRGLENVLQFTFTNQLLGAAQAQMQQTIGSQLPVRITPAESGEPDVTFANKPLLDFVTLNITNGELRFIVKQEANLAPLGPRGNAALRGRIEKLNKNYASRLNRVVKATAHLNGSSSYGPVLEATLKGTGLLGDEEEEQKDNDS